MEQYKRKINKFKVFLTVCALIILCVIIVIVAKKPETESVATLGQSENIINAENNNIINDVIQVVVPQTSEESKAEEEFKPEEKPEAEETKTKVPVYDEEAKEKLSGIYRSNEGKRAFLTFDDGPSYNVTPKILDVLKENNIKATFFVLGSMVEKNPDIVKRAYDEGHYIANHGYSHVYSSIYETPENVLAEYEQCNEAVKAAIGNDKYSSKLFRFPGGYAGGPYASVKKQAAEILANNGIGYVDWNCLTQDSTGNYSPSQLMKYLKETSWEKSSIVILMHDASAKTTTYEMLQDAINYLREQGYNFYSFYDIMGETEV